DAFKEGMELVRGMAEERSITLSGKKESDKGINVDRTCFKQVIVNLLSNAIKYNKEGGSVTFGCKDQANGMVHIYVTDTGRGISEDRMAKLFDPFERLGSEHSEIEGTGIGLAISKKLVEAMGGTIGCESVPGEGSTFWIEFPCPQEIQKEAMTGDGDDNRKPGLADIPEIPGTLLYVEDNPENLELMELIVSGIRGMSIISAHNAELGMELAKAKNPDLIILDINLPGMNGIEAVKNLHECESTNKIPVLAISAAATEKDIEKGLEAGFLRYLTKPVQVPQVINAIESALAG
ncbi:MAG: ATP-binding protein, partial [Rhodospirillales bacterium]|nr:ATP-binding protein [Rhodospirillales bacterium]